ncbi:MAG: hypothetical protein KME13_19815 [Myxacorys californica WJT36-NPBG1]|jgi:fructose-specific phosphotransferase system component IIB|nr:hypothetical protein [Myxacorys californica WJT36-NPBG1]
MSDLVKGQPSKAPSQLVNQTEPKQKQKQNLTPQQETAPEIDLEDELSEVAIAAADAPFAKAYQVYEDRFSANLKLFQSHVKTSQQKVKTLLKDAIYEAHGVKESDLYGDEENE